MAFSPKNRKLISLLREISTAIETHDPVHIQRKATPAGSARTTCQIKAPPLFHLHGLLEPGDVVRLSHPCVYQNLS